MNEERPLVSVVIPARNEERDIEDCLAAVAAQDYPVDRVEVIVVDGASTDCTREHAEDALASVPFHRSLVVENPAGTTPANLNLGLAHAKGDYLCRVDARSVIPRQYLRRCVEVLAGRQDVAVVGGRQIAEAREDADVVARGIARGLRNPYTTGLAKYRRSRVACPTDTVYLGAFRRRDLERLGGWDERLLTNQDYELNQRLGREGLVWFDPDLKVTYRPRSTLSSLAAQYLRFGRWKAAMWVGGRSRIAPRQVVLLIAPPIALTAAVGVARRRPIVAGVVTILLVVLADAQEDTPSSPCERAVSIVATVTSTGAWWIGVVSGFARWLGSDGSHCREATTR